MHCHLIEGWQLIYSNLFIFISTVWHRSNIFAKQEMVKPPTNMASATSNPCFLFLFYLFNLCNCLVMFWFCIVITLKFNISSSEQYNPHCLKRNLQADLTWSKNALATRLKTRSCSLMHCVTPNFLSGLAKNQDYEAQLCRQGHVLSSCNSLPVQFNRLLASQSVHSKCKSSYMMLYLHGSEKKKKTSIIAGTFSSPIYPCRLTNEVCAVWSRKLSSEVQILIKNLRWNLI